MIAWQQYKAYRNFGLLVGAILLGISLWPLIKGQPPRLWLTAIAAVLVLAAVVWPQGLSPVYSIWIKIGDGLGWINSRIILGIVFYGMFTPMGLMMKVLGKDPLQKKPDPQATTYWSEKQPIDHHDSMKYQF